MTAALKALAERLEKARDMERELSVAIYAALWEGHPISEEIAERRWQAYGLTESLDAATALCERVLPSREWSVWTDQENNKYHAQVGDDVWDEAMGFIAAFAATPALALVLAVVRAKLAEEAE